tara:strand:+ start:5117 stop:5359 length:243 start_codon:yes stop_codon:yes gene_type:complete
MNKKKLLIIGSISAVAVIGFILFKKFKPKTEAEKLQKVVKKAKEKTKEVLEDKISLLKLPKQECLKRGGRHLFGGCIGAK